MPHLQKKKEKIGEGFGGDCSIKEGGGDCSIKEEYGEVEVG